MGRIVQFPVVSLALDSLEALTVIVSSSAGLFDQVWAFYAGKSVVELV